MKSAFIFKITYTEFYFTTLDLTGIDDNIFYKEVSNLCDRSSPGRIINDAIFRVYCARRVIKNKPKRRVSETCGAPPAIFDVLTNYSVQGKRTTNNYSLNELSLIIIFYILITSGTIFAHMDLLLIWNLFDQSLDIVKICKFISQFMCAHFSSPAHQRKI